MLIPNSPAENYGVTVAEQWLDWTEDQTDHEHDLAQDLRDGVITDAELVDMAAAFVLKMAEQMAKIIEGARAEIAED